MATTLETLKTYFEYGRKINESSPFKSFCKIHSFQDHNSDLLELNTLYRGIKRENHNHDTSDNCEDLSTNNPESQPHSHLMQYS